MVSICQPYYGHSTYYLLHAVGYSELSNKEFVSMVLTRSVASGLPIICLHNMYVRAESDHLTPFIYLVKYRED